MLEYQKKLLEHIYSSQETLAAAKDLVNIKQANSTNLEYQKDVLEEINSSSKKQEALNDLIEVFYSKDSDKINMQYINDCLKPFLENKEMGFTFEDNWLYKVWNKDHTVSLYVTGQWGFQIGFWGNKNFTDEEKQKHIDILEKTFEKEFKSVEIERSYRDYWVCLIIKPLAGKSNMDDFLEYCTSFIPQVKERFLAL